MRPYLFVDKVVGGVNFCLGLSKIRNMISLENYVYKRK